MRWIGGSAGWPKAAPRFAREKWKRRRVSEQDLSEPLLDDHLVHGGRYERCRPAAGPQAPDLLATLALELNRVGRASFGGVVPQGSFEVCPPPKWPRLTAANASGRPHELFRCGPLRGAKCDMNPSVERPGRIAWFGRGAFAHLPFLIIWTANTASLVGIAMFDTATGWLMTQLNTDPLAVSFVQTATNLPMFLFTLVAGALADIVEPRRFLIAVSSFIVILTAIFATLVSLDVVTQTSLLVTIFLLGAAWALNAPSWLSIVPALVPKEQMGSAISANGIGYNISRAVGPALGGIAISWFGLAAPVWLFCASNIASVLALLWWRAPRKNASSLPAERLTSAVRTGMRHALNNHHFRATLVRTLAIYPFVSAHLALLPLIARQSVNLPEFYGILLNAISVGAIVGSMSLNRLRSWLGSDRLVGIATVGISCALVLYGASHDQVTTVGSSLLAGASWLVILSELYVSAQVALPAWVRGRGLAIFLTVVFGAMTVSSAVWGKVASVAGTSIALYSAAAGAVLAIPLTWRWRLRTAADVDLTPSGRRVPPRLARPVEDNRGPVLVTVEYHVDPAHRVSFLKMVGELGYQRRRDGAYAWNVFEDATEADHFIETFLIESWLELRHLRRRTTKADRMFSEQIRPMLRDDRQIGLFVAPDR